MTKNHLLITAPTDRLVCCKEKRREEAMAIRYITSILFDINLKIRNEMFRSEYLYSMMSQQRHQCVRVNL